MILDPPDMSFRNVVGPARIAGIDGGQQLAMVFERLFRFAGQQDVGSRIERQVDAERAVNRVQLGIAGNGIDQVVKFLTQRMKNGTVDSPESGALGFANLPQLFDVRGIGLFRRQPCRQPVKRDANR